MRPMTMRTLCALVASIAVAGLLAASARAAAPTNTFPPLFTGSLMHGRTLTASNGTWSNDPTTFVYRWQRCAADGSACGDIDNAAQKTYKLTSADVDHTVRVVVTASNSDGQTSANSKVSVVVSANTDPTNTVKPSVSGTAQPGEELTASDGTWTGGVRTFAYQWQRCDTAGANCTDVAGATGKTYGVRGIDVDHTLRVVVKATNLAGSTTVNSDASAVVKAPTAPTPPPTAVNHRPTIAILSVRFVGASVYARFRVCDDSRKNLSIVQRDASRASRPTRGGSARLFRLGRARY